MSTSSSQCLKLICNGEFEIIKIEEELHEEAVKLFLNYFLKYENLSIACNLNNSEQTRNEMEAAITAILQDNISIAARHIKSKQLAAICINKMASPLNDLPPNGTFAALQSPNMKKINEILHHVESKYDIYEEWQVDCVIELTFLCTRTEFARNGLALALAEYTIEFARQLKLHNINVTPKQQHLPVHVRHLRPEAITSVFTSIYSQKIGEKLGFQTLVKVPYKQFSYESKILSEKIDSRHGFITYAALRL